MGIRGLISVAVMITVSACATSYQSDGFSGGFKETQLGPDIYRVSFNGNAYTSRERVQDFALLRAAELTLQSGARYFVVVSENDQTHVSTHVTPGSIQTYAGQTTYRSPRVDTYYKPGVGMLVRLLHTKPENAMFFDAEFLAASIRAKYGIR
jgi:hypothetical protein